jgi:hypothetical protein
MYQHHIRRGVFIGLLVGMIVLGFVSGSVSQRPAQAQVPGLGGALGSAQELGSSIVEMQQHVDGLQKNLATLKKVQSALHRRGWHGEEARGHGNHACKTGYGTSR